MWQEGGSLGVKENHFSHAKMLKNRVGYPLGVRAARVIPSMVELQERQLL